MRIERFGNTQREEGESRGGPTGWQRAEEARKEAAYAAARAEKRAAEKAAAVEKFNRRVAGFDAQSPTEAEILEYTAAEQGTAERMIGRDHPDFPTEKEVREMLATAGPGRKNHFSRFRETGKV